MSNIAVRRRESPFFVNSRHRGYGNRCGGTQVWSVSFFRPLCVTSPEFWRLCKCSTSPFFAGDLGVRENCEIALQARIISASWTRSLRLESNARASRITRLDLEPHALL